MFSILSNKLIYSDLKTAVENGIQTRPFEIVRTGSSINIPIKPGYKGNTILKDSFNFLNRLFDTYIPLKPGDRILLYGQTNKVENGIWNVTSIIDGSTNIQRPDDYATNRPIRSGQYLLIVEGQSLSGKIYKNITPEYDSNGNKIIAYNGSSEQIWQDYRYLGISLLKPEDKVIFYANSFYQGYNATLPIGEYPNLFNIPEMVPLMISGPEISSIKIPIGYKVQVFEASPPINVASITLYSDTPNLADYSWNNRIQAINISSVN
jgi:hypothetical protein